MGLNFEQGKFFSVPVCPELLCQGWAGGCPQLPLVHGKEVFGFPPLPGDGIVGQGQGQGWPWGCCPGQSFRRTDRGGAAGAGAPPLLRVHRQRGTSPFLCRGRLWFGGGL